MILKFLVIKSIEKFNKSRFYLKNLASSDKNLGYNLILDKINLVVFY